MRHLRKGRKLKRTASHRKALLSNLAIALIKHKRIKTTEAKAKELRTYIEPLLTKAKKALSFQNSAPEKSIHQRRIVRKLLNDKESIQILFDEIAEKIKARAGGYTRVLKTGFRAGDGANEALIEFVDYSIIKEKETAQKKKEEIKKTLKEKEEVTKPVEDEKKDEAKEKKVTKPKATTKAKKETKKVKEEKPKSEKKAKTTKKAKEEKPKKEVKTTKTKKSKKED